MKKILILTVTVLLVLSSCIVFASSDVKQKNPQVGSKTEIVYVDDSVLDLGEKEITEVVRFNQGMVTKLQDINYFPKVDKNGVWGSNDKIVEEIEAYCSSHFDILSGVIYEEAMKQAESNNIQISLDEKSPLYKKYIKTYDVNDNVSVTITPNEIYIDEYVEKPVVKGEATATTASWKYKSVATRRTWIEKITVKGKTYSFKIFSTHTGGEVKYNGSRAKHSAAYYAYDFREEYGAPFTFKKIVAQNEQISGTSWHYKYMGKVRGTISIPKPINITISTKDKLLGCQVITNKKGNVTKNYWPAL